MNHLTLESIKNIIFDLGGVLLNIDYKLTDEAFRKLGIDNFDEIFSKLSQSDLFDKLEKGLISYDAFRTELKKIFNKPINDFEIDNAWNALLLDFPKERIELLKKLKNKFNIYLLSNTNEMHCKFYNNRLKAAYQIENLDALFKKTYYSHLIHLRKPDKVIYEYVLNDSHLKPAETLFIDDLLINIEAANLLGIKGYWLKEGEEVVKLFEI